MAILGPYFYHCCDLTDFWTCTFLSFALWKSCCLSDLEGSWLREINRQKLIKSQSYGESNKFYVSFALSQSLHGLIKLQNSLAWKNPLKVSLSSLLLRPWLIQVMSSIAATLKYLTGLRIGLQQVVLSYAALQLHFKVQVETHSLPSKVITFWFLLLFNSWGMRYFGIFIDLVSIIRIKTRECEIKLAERKCSPSCVNLK